MNRIDMWTDMSKGVKSRFAEEVNPPVGKRESISDEVVQQKAERGTILQRARLGFAPSTDVDRENLFAGRIEGDLDDAADRLQAMGFRNNPTAYVEVTEENGPDDGSYSKNIITERGGSVSIPTVTNRPSFFLRVKEQIHTVVYDVGESVEFLVHRENSAWLQPMRHTFANESSARRGVRDFRDSWFDEFGEELPGKSEVKWDTTN